MGQLSSHATFTEKLVVVLNLASSIINQPNYLNPNLDQ